MTQNERLLPVVEAGRRLGVPLRTLRRRIEDGTIPLYEHDRDRRQKLVAIDDVAKLFRPRLVSDGRDVDSLNAA